MIMFSEFIILDECKRHPPVRTRNHRRAPGGDLRDRILFSV